MPKRTDIQSILVIGAGPIVIGQACEFDYSGTQGIQALKEEGYRVILVNSNPATIMTDPELADATYIEPISPAVVEKIIAKERPDALLPTLGGQTALNCALDLHDNGVLERYGVEMIGAKPDVIHRAEDRQAFKEVAAVVGVETARSVMVGANDDLEQALELVGLPAILRPSFTLGGAGGGIAYSKDEFFSKLNAGIAESPAGTVLVEESILGWKEYELEVVRDSFDNAIIVCSIENIDPMGVHTGDSITVAPQLTLTDREYQKMRTDSLAIMREVGVDTGGSNVQFAVNPADGRQIVIEMNPRVSRSSALASKATGFPIARVAARLAVGYGLHELPNQITKTTPASFEPSIDYVITKVPRFDFAKFSPAEPYLDTTMHAIGESLSIGRNFKESLQKALCSLEQGLTGLDSPELEGRDHAFFKKELQRPKADRLLVVAEAMRAGLSCEELHDITKIDPWFLREVSEIVAREQEIIELGWDNISADAELFTELKKEGFSDARLGKLLQQSEEALRERRQQLNIHAFSKKVDSSAGELASKADYFYQSYDCEAVTPFADETNPDDREKVIILGSGPNRIGQGIEFDYCCVRAAKALRELGYQSIMLNCNPETVSTDFDCSDRLYITPMTVEAILEVVNREQTKGELLGVLVPFGGQTPLNLAAGLAAAGVKLIGTSFDAIETTENREAFQAFIDRIGLKQSPGAIATGHKEALEIADRLGYPLLVRPSFVIGGRAMHIVRSEAQMLAVLGEALAVAEGKPLLVDRFLEQATELDVDAISDGERVEVVGLLEHIEEAGVHSGDSACSYPPHSLCEELQQELIRQAKLIVSELQVRGLTNIQFAVQGDQIFVIEVNPRASRTVPFVAKTSGIPLVDLAVGTLMGNKLPEDVSFAMPSDYIAVKEVVFPFDRFVGVDTVLGPEMRSTGEVMGLDRTFGRAFLKAQQAAKNHLPTEGQIFFSVRDEDKEQAAQFAKSFSELGFELVATRGTADSLEKAGCKVTRVSKEHEREQGLPGNSIIDHINSGEVSLLINSTFGGKSVQDGARMRRRAVVLDIPYLTTMAAADAALRAIRHYKQSKPLDVTALQQYHLGQAN